jgi:hypothetical protein
MTAITNFQRTYTLIHGDPLQVNASGMLATNRA